MFNSDLRLRCIFTALLLSFAFFGEGADVEGGYHRWCGKVDAAAVSPVVGIWRMGQEDGNAVICILPSAESDEKFNIFLLDSPDWTIPSGALCGEIKATADPSVFDCRMREFSDSRTLAEALSTNTTATVILTELNRRMTFKPYRRSKRISLRRWLPYLFRVSVIEDSNRPDGLDGAVRLYPLTDGTTPVSL